MEPFKKLISRAEALDIVLKNIKKLNRFENIPIEESVGRVLSRDIVAEFNVPPFDRSSMDGYAVHAEDTFGAGQFSPRRLLLIGVQHAGELFEGGVEQGECIEIATGSPIPEGANAVVMVEYTKREGDFVEINRPVYPGANVSVAGEDIKKGETVLNNGEFINPAKIGALAALGNEKVSVIAKPLVAIYSTGMEVSPLGRPLEVGEIYDINSYTLKSVVEANGGKAVRGGIIGDAEEKLITVIKGVPAFDLVIFSGGSSVGSRDLFRKVIEETGEILFHGVQVKPGKPTLFGIVDGVPVFGMPGYPTSCLSNAYLFLTPALRKLAGLPSKKYREVKARMGHRLVSTSGREQFITVRLKDGIAYTVYKQSGDITSLSRAEGYVVLPINQDTLEEDEEVIVTLLD